MEATHASDAAHGGAHDADVGVSLHTREGFVGDVCATLRPNSSHQFTTATGPHTPKRFELRGATTPDHADPAASPVPLLRGRSGLVISLSTLSRPMPHAFKNVECDELHFVQAGELDFVTAFGTLRASAGDFVCVGRSVGYRINPIGGGTLRLVIELPERLRLAPSQPFGVVNGALHVASPDPAKPSGGEVGNELWLKSIDGISRYTMAGDPLAVVKHLGGPIPVWRLNLRHIAQQTTTSRVGPPAQFAETKSRNSLFFTLSARAVNRPPHHENADYDEVILYFAGPGAWGGVSEPGTLTWCPKGTTHWGPGEDVEGGYWAWLLECADTLRLTKEGERFAALMETGDYGAQAPKQ